MIPLEEPTWAKAKLLDSNNQLLATGLAQFDTALSSGDFRQDDSAFLGSIPSHAAYLEHSKAGVFAISRVRVCALKDCSHLHFDCRRVA